MQIECYAILLYRSIKFDSLSCTNMCKYKQNEDTGHTDNQNS